MIIEIAAGIVLAVVFLWLLPALLVVGATLLGAAAVLAIVGVVIYGFATGHSGIMSAIACMIGLGVVFQVWALIENRRGTKIELRKGISRPTQIWLGGILASVCALGLLAAFHDTQETEGIDWQATLVGTSVALALVALALSALRAYRKHQERQRVAALEQQQRQSAVAVEHWRKVFAERTKRLDDGGASSGPPP